MSQPKTNNVDEEEVLTYDENGPNVEEVLLQTENEPNIDEILKAFIYDLSNITKDVKDKKEILTYEEEVLSHDKNKPVEVLTQTENELDVSRDIKDKVEEMLTYNENGSYMY